MSVHPHSFLSPPSCLLELRKLSVSAILHKALCISTFLRGGDSRAELEQAHPLLQHMGFDVFSVSVLFSYYLKRGQQLHQPRGVHFSSSSKCMKQRLFPSQDLSVGFFFFFHFPFLSFKFSTIELSLKFWSESTISSLILKTKVMLNLSFSHQFCVSSSGCSLESVLPLLDGWWLQTRNTDSSFLSLCSEPIYTTKKQFIPGKLEINCLQNHLDPAHFWGVLLWQLYFFSMKIDLFRFSTSWRDNFSNLYFPRLLFISFRFY